MADRPAGIRPRVLLEKGSRGLSPIVPGYTSVAIADLNYRRASTKLSLAPIRAPIRFETLGQCLVKSLIGGQSVEVINDDVGIEQVDHSFQPARTAARYRSTSCREQCAAP